jgi:CheY-like chemotaxis protein
MNTPAVPKCKILVVDDDFDLCGSFALLLEFDGHQVQTAYTGEAALAKLAKCRFDLLISEYWLPRMRGDQLAMEVKQQYPELPIIMVTANFAEIHLDDHPVAGVNCLLDKPFTMEQLRNAMHWVLADQLVKPEARFEIRLPHGVYRPTADVPPDPPEYRALPVPN